MHLSAGRALMGPNCPGHRDLHLRQAEDLAALHPGYRPPGFEEFRGVCLSRASSSPIRSRAAIPHHRSAAHAGPGRWLPCPVLLSLPVPDIPKINGVSVSVPGQRELPAARRRDHDLGGVNLPRLRIRRPGR